MVNLTFGEQVKIILGRKGMTIKELAELMEQHTGKPMSRQNMTQRLGRDNFQEKDMRSIAEILGCKFQLSIMEMDEVVLENSLTRDITIGELADMAAEVEALETVVVEPETVVEEIVVEESVITEDMSAAQVIRKKVEHIPENEEKDLLRKGIKRYFGKSTQNVVQTTERTEAKKDEKPVVGDFNPYTGKEYKTNSVRMHPSRIGYVQVYDQEQHKWTDMTEWAFLGYQERKKMLLGKDYEPPIYLD